MLTPDDQPILLHSQSSFPSRSRCPATGPGASRTKTVRASRILQRTIAGAGVNCPGRWGLCFLLPSHWEEFRPANSRPLHSSLVPRPTNRLPPPSGRWGFHGLLGKPLLASAFRSLYLPVTRAMLSVNGRLAPRGRSWAVMGLGVVPRAAHLRNEKPCPTSHLGGPGRQRYSSATFWLGLTPPSPRNPGGCAYRDAHPHHRTCVGTERVGRDVWGRSVSPDRDYALFGRRTQSVFYLGINRRVPRRRCEVFSPLPPRRGLRVHDGRRRFSVAPSTWWRVAASAKGTHSSIFATTGH